MWGGWYPHARRFHSTESLVTDVHRLHRTLAAAVLLLTSGLLASPAVQAQTRLLRFPDIHGDRVVFTYAGDLWTAPAAGGTGHAADGPSGHRAVREVLARRQVDRLHRASTTATSRSTSSRRPAACRQQLTFYPARGPLTPRWGYDNQVYGWTARRQGHPLPLACATRGRSGQTRLYTVPVAGGPAEPLPMPESGAGDYSPDGTKVVYSPLLPRLPPREALRRRAGQRPVHLRPEDERREAHHRPPARRSRPDVDRQHDLLHVRSRRHVQPLRLRRRVGEDHAGHDQPHLGRALAQRRPPEPHRLRAERRAAGARRQDRQEHRASRSRCPTTACGSARRASRPPARSRTSSCRPRASARCSRRAATSSRRRSRRAPTRNLTSIVRRARQVGALVAGRLDDRVHLGPQRRRRALRRSRRTARASPSSSRPAARPCATSRSGRPTASGSRSATRTARSSSTRSTTRSSPQIVDAPRGQVRDYTWSPTRQLPGLQHDRRQRLPRRSTSGARGTASCARSPTSCSTPRTRRGIRTATTSST